MTQTRFAYFGTPYVARDTLVRLVERGWKPAIVITSPDAARGRGMNIEPCETKAWALENGFEVLSPARLDASAIGEIKRYDCTFGIVVAYGKILPQQLIDAFPKGLLNIHYSLLPKYRGASPVEAALLHNDNETGVTIQKLAFELDAGDILAERSTPIEPAETTRELRARLITLGAELLADSLSSFIDGTASFTPQDPSQVSHSGRIQKSEGELDLSGDAQQNWNKYRAYAESPGTYFFIERDGKKVRVKIKSAKFENGKFAPLRVVPEGKKEMDYADFSSARR